jgi:hypothetical protein
MTDPSPGDARGDVADFLRERLERGDACLCAGNARGAIVWYESALGAHRPGDDAGDLRDLLRALWHNKAIAHQQLRELVPAQEAALYAERLSRR